MMRINFIFISSYAIFEINIHPIVEFSDYKNLKVKSKMEVYSDRFFIESVSEHA